MSKLATVLCAAIILLATSLVHAQNAPGVRITPDATAILVNKDVGNERWAITLNIDEDSFSTGNVTGNVFRTDGDPAFIYCEWFDGDVEDLANTTVSWDCFGADRCTNRETCTDDFEEWADLGEVSLPGTFFLP
jgi:hypothetical protein